MHENNVRTLCQILAAIDERPDKGTPEWGIYRSAMIKVHNRRWYGLDDTSHGVDPGYPSIQGNPRLVGNMSGTRHIMAHAMDWFDKVNALDNSGYNIFQRYGLSLLDLLYAPPQLLTALDKIRAAETKKEQNK